MVRARHTPHQLPSFPVYSAAFLSANELVLGAGGGASKSGIKNKLRLYNVGDDRSLDLVDEFEMDKEEDAPMSIAANLETKEFVAGINSTLEKLANGENENCRVFGIKENKLALIEKQGTLNTGDVEDYQKVTTLSPDGTLLAVAGSKYLSLLAYPSLLPVAEALKVSQGEIYDATFSIGTSVKLLVATTTNLLLYAVPSASSTSKSKKGKQKEIPLNQLELLETVALPTLPGGVGATFRAARYHPTDEDTLYTVLNTTPAPRSRSTKAKAIPRQAYVCKWSTSTWKPLALRKVGDKGITCFDISSNGKWLAYGSSDYTIGVLDATSLSPLLTILKAHDFPPTAIRFNPTSTLLVSGSVDNTVRVVTIPQSLGGQSWGTILLILFALMAVLLAVLAQKAQSS
ncbi:hypothetical protein PLICRDRAFT_48333 [Plicaturopsis crispa FD-325 SS-3]|nr:hypothetical protein PLICRDRAFT_48333 [Plicaturopsis crispa FD-325 SS-3]